MELINVFNIILRITYMGTFFNQNRILILEIMKLENKKNKYKN